MEYIKKKGRRLLMNHKAWVRGLLTMLVVSVVIWITITVIVDPYFHYHKPMESLSYRLYYERYINDGIARHFDYNAMIVGTSMTQNFKTTDLEGLYGVDAIKTPFQGAGYEELSQFTMRALEYNEDIELIVRAVDLNGLTNEAGWQNYTEYPDYLYDDNIWNDIQYTLDKNVMYQGVFSTFIRTIQGLESTTFDEYSSTNVEVGYAFDFEAGVPLDTRPASREITEEEIYNVIYNVEYYLIPAIEAYPDVEFLLFFPPYNIEYWNAMSEIGDIDVEYAAMMLTAERLLNYPNVSLYYYYDQYELVRDLSQYLDRLHYGSHINTQILEWMYEGTGLLTLENYQTILEQDRIFYTEYNYLAVPEVNESVE